MDKSTLERFYDLLGENLDYSEIAKRYINLFLEKESWLNQFSKRDLHKTFIITNFTEDLEFLTKRLCLISNQLIFTEGCGSNQLLYQEIEEIFNPKNSVTSSHYLVREEKIVYVENQDLSLLGKWIIDCKEFIRSERILYIPSLTFQKLHVIEHEVIDLELPQVQEIALSSNKPYLSTFLPNDAKLVYKPLKEVINSSEKVEILSFEIPNFDEFSIESCSKICQEMNSEIENFRFILKEFLRLLEGNKMGNGDYELKQEMKNSMEISIKKLKEAFNFCLERREISKENILLFITVKLLGVNNLGEIVEQYPDKNGNQHRLINEIGKKRDRSKTSSYLWMLE